MKTELENTQAYLLAHHGGDGALAARRTQESHDRNHDEGFWRFWNTHTQNCLPANGHLIDLGAGVGLFMQTMARQNPEMTVSGIDCASYMLDRTVSLPNNAAILIDDLNAPSALFDDHSIDACIANMLIHELHQPILLFKQIKRWLKPGGCFVLIDMVRQPLESYLTHKHPDATGLSRTELEDSFQHFLEHNRYTPDDLCFILRHCGLDIVEVESIKRGRAVRIAAKS